MTKRAFNIMIIALIWSLFAFIGYTAAERYTSEQQPKTADTAQTETFKGWKQSVTAEYNRQNITYKGGDIK